jgi:hypothetical protein
MAGSKVRERAGWTLSALSAHFGQSAGVSEQDLEHVDLAGAVAGDDVAAVRCESAA